MKKAIIALLLLLTLTGCISPKHVYLTWQGDTSATMTVNYQAPAGTQACAVHYDTIPRNGIPGNYTYTATGSMHQIPGLRDGRVIHTIELTGLTGGAAYYFIVGNEVDGYTDEQMFRTIPNDGSPLRFIVGGDMGVLPHTPALLDQAAKLDPMFVVIGGDIAYANGELDNAWRWDWMLDDLSGRLLTSEGAMVPLVFAIGNHEVNDKEGGPAERAPFYFGFCAQGGRSYFSRTFGSDVAFIILDSGHIEEPGGEQATWLDADLARYQGMKYVMAAYHVPLYPSYRSFDDSRSVAGREHWLPLFDAYGLDAAFEHHDHTFKRTPPMRNGAPDPEGAVYLGDGCFGVPARAPRNGDAAYIAVTSSTPHFWLVDVTGDGVRYRAVNVHGDVFDQYP